MNVGGGTEACPVCGWSPVGCVDSRPHALGRRRRRECSRCLHRWTTVEMPLETAEALVRMQEAFIEAGGAIKAALEEARDLRAFGRLALPELKEPAE